MDDIEIQEALLKNGWALGTGTRAKRQEQIKSVKDFFDSEDRESIPFAANHLIEYADEIVDILISEAKRGDYDSSRLLVIFIRNAIARLRNDVCVLGNETIKDVAAKELLWPVLINCHRDVVASAKEYTRALGLGTKTGIGFTNKKPFEIKEQGATRLVLDLYMEIFQFINGERFVAYKYGILKVEDAWQSLALDLPPLSKQEEAIELWWAAIESLFKEKYSDSFEGHPRFEKYWKDSAVTSLPEKQWRANVRRNIKSRLKQSLRTIAVREFPGS